MSRQGKSKSKRIERRFAELKDAGRAGLVTFVTAGDPNPDTSREILLGLTGAGADLIELGMPFSDPMADGPAIQLSSQRALAAGGSMKTTLALVRDFRAADDATPVILMGYYNPIYIYGPERFLADAGDAGVDGLIIVDLPPEEDELLAPLENSGIDLIYLTAPTTDDARLPVVVKNAGGFIYYVSVTGITGTKSAAQADIASAVARLRTATELPIAVGFGIRTPAQAAEVASSADAVVVGSALVSALADNLDDDGAPGPGCAGAVHQLVRELAAGVRQAATERK
ncbi:MAG: tryptophan synthase subunit alpha [Rhodospirillaceae bacterium]|jgi:tryptophan synthase alpha chain|nr:tryptophan synthase subunit alpha [Rhodospirillaceae bacterium]